MCRYIERSRYEKGVTIFTSNRLAEWGMVSAIRPSRPRFWTVYCTTLS
jgi:hypothetical protein